MKRRRRTRTLKICWIPSKPGKKSLSTAPPATNFAESQGMGTEDELAGHQPVPIKRSSLGGKAASVSMAEVQSLTTSVKKGKKYVL